jgi:hypothetical protein
VNRKILLTVLALATVLLATPLVSAVPWTYPKNNDKFELFGTTIAFDYSRIVAANYAATAGLGAGDANKITVIVDELALPSYQIRIGEGADQKVYNLYDPATNTGDFTYSGVEKIVTYDPVLPYVFDPTNPFATILVQGSKQHFRVDYVYDFSAVPGGLDGTITMLALVTGNSLVFSGDRSMSIVSVKGTGDFANVQIHATSTATGHEGNVFGWPE